MSPPPRSRECCPADVRHIARQSLADAIGWLESRPLSDRAVHAVRKDLKRVRAMLRLMRPALRSEDYHHDNALLRDVARSLSAARDSKVLLDTLRDLPRASAATVPERNLRSHLEREHAHSRGRLRADGACVRQACKSLRSVRRRLTQKPASHYDRAVLSKGLQRVYGRTRAALKRAQARRTVANLHELRKQTKYLWHQLEALRAARPSVNRALIAATHRLSDLLGDEHNLAVLHSRVLGASLPVKSRQALLARIAKRREHLVSDALALAQRTYQDRPAALVTRVLGRDTARPGAAALKSSSSRAAANLRPSSDGLGQW